MTARAMWKGALRLGDEAVPVKFYSAAAERRVHFHLLHGDDLVRVKQRMVHPETGAEVATDDVSRGVELEPGLFVTLTDEELAELEPEASRDIELLTFVPRGAIRSQWRHRPYWLGPDGSESDAYFALVDALQRKGREGVARWTMRKRAYVGALSAERGRLLMTSLRHAEEVVVLDDMDAPGGRDLDDREVALAERLVSALEDRFDPAAFKDEHRARVMALIESKAKGEKLELPRVKKKKPARSLLKALEASLRRAKEPRVA